MEQLKTMENVKKETKKAFKKFNKNLIKYEAVINAENENKAMRHTPTEAEEAARAKFRKSIFNTEKFILIDIATMLEVLEENPTDIEKRFKQRKQYRTESVSHKVIVDEIIGTENLREKFEKALQVFNEKNITL